MIGAIVGDVVGSIYEFNNYRRKDFNLLEVSSKPTDDSIMTLAVAEICQKRLYDDKDKVIDTFKKWGRTYPNAGYGGRFRDWLFSDKRDAYNSFGNGAAMRISPVGWYGRNEEEVKYIARKVTEVTHNHEEGLKGAEVVAMCIYYARKGKSKEFIKKYVSKYYDIDFEYEDLRKTYKFKETCQESIPQAIYCFLISNNFEDCLRTTISIGGDCDTTAAIACSIAEAYYKDMDVAFVKTILNRLPREKEGCNPRNVVLEFYKYQDVVSIYDCDKIEDNKLVIGIERLYADKKMIEFIYSKTLYTLSRYLINILIGEDDEIYKVWKLGGNMYCIRDEFVKNILVHDDSHSDDIVHINAICNVMSLNKKTKCMMFNKSDAIEYLKEKYNVDYLILSRQYEMML